MEVVNIKYVWKYAESWIGVAIVQRTVALIAWRRNMTLSDIHKDLYIFALGGTADPVNEVVMEAKVHAHLQKMRFV